MKVIMKSGSQLSDQSILIWRIAQFAVWLIGVAILFCLLLFPPLGVLLFWNILIPVAPALLVVFTGVWRNVCPLASTNLLPRHLGWSKRKILSPQQLGKLNLAAVIALYVIVPLRHAVFNSNGVATALLILALAAMGVSLGFFYEWKSAWCSGLCPIHPVEKLYGENVVMTIPNAHCHECMNCVIPCPDSTPNINPKASTKTRWHKISGVLITGGLPGFIWGWFQVPDQLTVTTTAKFFGVYAIPFVGMTVSLILYGILTAITKGKKDRQLVRFFAALAVSCYYWYRIPSLLGFGNFRKDGLLIDLHNVLPSWSGTAISIGAVSFFFYWLTVRRQNKKSWVIRPQYAIGKRRYTAKSSL